MTLSAMSFVLFLKKSCAEKVVFTQIGYFLSSSQNFVSFLCHFFIIISCTSTLIIIGDNTVALSAVV